MLALNLRKSLNDIDHMDWDEYQQWLAYHSLYPLDESRQDYRIAQLCALQCTGTHDLEEFVPRFGEGKKIETLDDLKTFWGA